MRLAYWIGEFPQRQFVRLRCHSANYGHNWKGDVCRRLRENRHRHKWKRLPHCSDRRSMAFRDAAKVAASSCVEEDTCADWAQCTTLLVIVEDDEGDGERGGEENEDGTCVVDACELGEAKGTERNHCSLGSCRVEVVLRGALRVVDGSSVLEE